MGVLSGIRTSLSARSLNVRNWLAHHAVGEKRYSREEIDVAARMRIYTRKMPGLSGWHLTGKRGALKLRIADVMCSEGIVPSQGSLKIEQLDFDRSYFSKERPVEHTDASGNDFTVSSLSVTRTRISIKGFSFSGAVYPLGESILYEYDTYGLLGYLSRAGSYSMFRAFYGLSKEEANIASRVRIHTTGVEVIDILGNRNRLKTMIAQVLQKESRYEALGLVPVHLLGDLKTVTTIWGDGALLLTYIKAFFLAGEEDRYRSFDEPLLVSKRRI